MILTQSCTRLSQIYDKIGRVGERGGLQSTVWRKYFTMGDIVAAQKLIRQDRIFGGDAQPSPLMSLVIAGQMPEVGAITHIDPGLWDSNDEATPSVAQITLQYHQGFIMIVLVDLLITIAAMLGQNIVASNTKCGIPPLHQRGNIGSTLKDHFQIWHTLDTCQILTGIAPADLHATFS